jgi:UDP-hydrolysing UDP-N-acetyl-D-glucosamine 2-epimerase
MQFTPPLVDLFKRYGGVGPEFDLSRGYIVVMQHPVTTEYAQSRVHVEETLNAVRELNLPTLWFWPNVDAGSDGTSKGIRSFREHKQLPLVHFFKNMPPEEFLRLLKASHCIVGNSSVAIRECAYLGIPAVNIGSRQQGRDRGRNVIDVAYDRAQIVAAVRQQIAHGHYAADAIYGDGAAGERIARVLATAPLTIEKRLTY